MSLYVIDSTDELPAIAMPAELKIEENTDIELLSSMTSTPVAIIRKRLANDHEAYVVYIKNEPAAVGWMAKGSAFIGELNHEIILPLGNRYLWNFRTLGKFRGLGIYPALLQFIIHKEKCAADLFWIIHAPENHSSLRGIQKAGFRPVGKLYSEKGITRIEETTGSLEYEHILAEMDITISGEPPASCWNCSSPYLKNRKQACCCSERNERCTRNELNLPEPMPALA